MPMQMDDVEFFSFIDNVEVNDLPLFHNILGHHRGILTVYRMHQFHLVLTHPTVEAEDHWKSHIILSVVHGKYRIRRGFAVVSDVEGSEAAGFGRLRHRT